MDAMKEKNVDSTLVQEEPQWPIYVATQPAEIAFP